MFCTHPRVLLLKFDDSHRVRHEYTIYIDQYYHNINCVVCVCVCVCVRIFARRNCLCVCVCVASLINTILNHSQYLDCSCHLSVDTNNFKRNMCVCVCVL